MKNKVLQLAAAALGTLPAAAPAVSLERSEVPERYQWDLGSLFAGEAQSVAAKDALKDTGVDMTTSQPSDAAMREMNRIMDEIVRIYARQKR